MKKIISILMSLAILGTLTLSGCNSEKDYSNYKNETGYEEYISDSKATDSVAPYYKIKDAMTTDKKALKYYKNNSRQFGDYIITNYLDGICINDYVGELRENRIEIPEIIDGKPVIKIGCNYNEDFRHYRDEEEEEFMGVFDKLPANLEIHLPSTVKYISKFSVDDIHESEYINGEQVLGPAYGYLLNFVVDENNPYYSSEDGKLYTKDKGTLLYEYKEIFMEDVGL